MEKQIVDTIIDRLVEDAKALWPDNFAEYEKRFNQCCFSISWKVIRELGFFAERGECQTLASMIDTGSLNPDASYVLEKLLYILTEEGTLSLEDDTYTLVKPALVEGPSELLVSLTRQFPGEAASFQWVARSYDGILELLRGQAYAEDILFPYNDLELVEDVYSTSGVYGFYSKLAGKAVSKFIRELYQKDVRALEVGAGTGAGTRNILDEVDGTFVSYDFTDISKTLLRKSKKKFTNNYMNFKIFDVTKPIEDQGFEESQYDVIFAVNVLHAVSDVTYALKSLYSLLAPGGCVILSEISPPVDSIYRYMELTFGLLPSYFGYQDKNVRPVSPIIRPDTWVEIFNGVGFSYVDALPYGKVDFEDRGGIIIGFR